MVELWIVLYAAVLLAVAGTIWARAGWDFFHPVPLFMIYLFIQLAASNLLYLRLGFPGEFSLPLPQGEGAYVRATWLGILATALVFVGALLARGKELSLGREWSFSGQRLWLLTIGAFAVGVISCTVLFRMNGGFAEFISSRERWRTVGMIGQGFLTFPATAGLNLIALIHVARAYATPGSAARRVIALVILVLSIIPAVLFGFRSAIFLPLLQAALVINYAGGRISPARIAAGATVVVALFTGYGAYREVAPQGGIDAATAVAMVSDRPDLALAVLSRSRGADVVANVITRLDVTPDFDWGPQSVLELLTIWIPRHVLAAKPVPSLMRFTTYFFGEQLAETRDDYQGYFGGISPTFVGETYWHSGYLGTVIFSLVWGFIGQFMYNTLRVHSQRLPLLVFYSAFWSSFVMSAETIQGYANMLVLGTAALAFYFVLLRAEANVLLPARPAQ